jgi:hypothetical protein
MTNYLINHPILITAISFVIIFILGTIFGWLIRGEKAQADVQELLENIVKLAEANILIKKEDIDEYA